MFDADPVFDALPVGVLVTDRDGRVVAANAAVTTLLGVRRDEIVGRPYEDLLVTEEDPSAPDGRFPSSPPPTASPPSTGAQPPAMAMAMARAHRFLRRDGKIMWARVDEAPLSPDLTVRTIVDVSDDKGAFEELAAKARAFARSNRDLEEFAAVASHDLQEPLRKIRVFGDRLASRHQDALGDEGLDYVGRMQAAAQRMQALIADLLAFSSTAWDDAPFERVRLREVVRDVLTDLEAAMEQAHGNVQAGPLPSIDADRSQMLRLFSNLIGNALKFRRPDSAPRIQVSAVLLEAWQGSGADVRGEAACQIVVSDNGIGFDSRHAERIFVPFRRLHGKDVYPGTGMGLAICRKIVERHRGTIQARGTPGVGSEFVVTLPVRQLRS